MSALAAHGGTVAALSNYVFPNDWHVHWSLMIVLYPYITGIVAGAFIVSSLYHVFGIKQLEPISRYSLIFALAFLACATWPLLLHLGHPERSYSMLITPNPTSAMAGFGFIYSAYFILLVHEILFIYRPTMVTPSIPSVLLLPVNLRTVVNVTLDRIILKRRSMRNPNMVLPTTLQIVVEV